MAGKTAYRTSSGQIVSGSKPTLPTTPTPTPSKTGKVTTITVSNKEYKRLSNIISSGGSVSKETINQNQIISSITTKPIQQLSGGTYDPNTNTFTDLYGNKSSTINPNALSQQVVEQKQKEELKSYSAKAGITAPGQSNYSYFKTSVNDVQTDSQAIKTATKIADEVTTKNIVSPQNILTRGLSPSLASVTKPVTESRPSIKTSSVSVSGNILFPGYNTEVIQTGRGKFYNIPSAGGYVDEKAFKQYEKDRSFKIDTPILSREEVIIGKVDIIKENQRQKQLATMKSEEAQFEVLGGYFAGGGSQITGLTSNVVTRGVTRLTAPVIKAVSPSLAEASVQVTKLLSPAFKGSASQAGRIGIGSPTAVATKQAVTQTAKKIVGSEQFKTLIKTETIGEALRQLGLYSPEIASAVYLESTKSTRKFNPNKKTDEIASDVYGAARVDYYGGTKNIVDYKGNVIETQQVEGKASMGEAFAEGFLPGIKVATGFAPTFKEKAQEKLKDDPEYKKLTGKAKAQYEKEFVDYYLNVAQIGQTVGQISIETGGEVTGGGRLFAISGIGGPIVSRGQAAVKFGLASGTTGIQEGVYSSELQAKTEKYELTDQDRLNSAILGGGFAGGFGALQGATIGTGKLSRGVNILGEAADFPGEPLGDVLGGKVKDILRVPDIKVGGSLIKTSFGPSVSSTTDVKSSDQTKSKGKPKTDFVLKTPSSDFIPGTMLTGETKSSLSEQEKKIAEKAEAKRKELVNQGKITVDVPGISVGSENIVKQITSNDEPIIDFVPDIVPDVTQDVNEDTEQKQDEQQKQEVSSQTPTFANVPSTVPVIAPQGFLLPGFFPMGSSQRIEAKQRTRIYDELAAAGKRFEQLSGLNFNTKVKKK